MADSDVERLKSALARVDSALAASRPAIAAALNPGLSEDLLEGLLERLGTGCREELAVWFGWHDGQSGYRSLLPDVGELLLDAERCLEEKELRKTDEEYDAPAWPPSWVPLLENGAGDYIVLETEGPQSGSLLNYWHDEPNYWEKPSEERVAYRSLVDWAERAAKTISESGAE